MNRFSANYKSESLNNTIFYIFLLVYAVVLFYLCKTLNIWVDETYTLDTTSRNLLEVITQSYNFEGQPPVYFLLLSIWRKVNSSVFFARLFSVIFIALAAFVFYKVVELVSKTASAKWMVVLFLLNPFAVWAAMEIRLYAFLVFLAIAAFYYLIQFYKTSQKKYLWYLIGLTVAGMYTQYFFAFLIAGFAMVILLYRGWKLFFTFCLYMLPALIIFLPSMFFASELTEYVQTQAGHSLLNQAYSVIQSTQNLLLSLQLIPSRVLKWGIKIPFILILLYSYYKFSKLNKKQAQPDFKIINAVLIITGVFILLILCFFGITRVDYQYRYLTIIFPLSILIFLNLNAFTLIIRQIIFCSIAVYYTVVLVFTYVVPVKEYDYERVAGFIQQIEKKGEPVLFYHNTISLSFNYYYKGSNTISPLPYKVKFDSSMYEGIITDSIQLQKILFNAIGASPSALIVSNYTDAKSVNSPGQLMFNNFLNAHYKISLDTLYFGRSKNHSLRIRRLEKNAN